MKQKTALVHEFVEFIPASINLKEGVIYVSMTYGVAAHRCCCGCGEEVVTPFSPTDWKLIFDGETISLNRSIGNWSFDCQSHYWIERNKIKWAGRWSQEEIESGRSHDLVAKEQYFGILGAKTSNTTTNSSETVVNNEAKPNGWQRLKMFLARWKS